MKPVQVVVLNGILTEAEQEPYVRQATKTYPVSIIEKLFLDVQGDQVVVGYALHAAKQAELRDTVPNPIP